MQVIPKDIVGSLTCCLLPALDSLLLYLLTVLLYRLTVSLQDFQQEFFPIPLANTRIEVFAQSTCSITKLCPFLLPSLYPKKPISWD